jgi:hypothetical protein
LVATACWDKPAPPAGIGFTAAWTNDDGVVNEPSDASDLGTINPTYDGHGNTSSDDPAEPGLDPIRYDKDVARCTAAVARRHHDRVDVTVEPGYPGYVCTFTATITNDTRLAAGVEPAVVTSDPGILVEEISEPALPEVLPPGDSAEAIFSVQVLQAAPQRETLTFAIDLQITRDRACRALTDADIPEGAILINSEGLCTFFFPARSSDCGPRWSDDEPHAWKFVVDRFRGRSGVLTAEFVSAGTVTIETPDRSRLGRLVYYVYTPAPDTLRGAYVEGLRAGRLYLAGTCGRSCAIGGQDRATAGFGGGCGSD